MLTDAQRLEIESIGRRAHELFLSVDDPSAAVWVAGLVEELCKTLAAGSGARPAGDALAEVEQRNAGVRQ